MMERKSLTGPLPLSVAAIIVAVIAIALNAIPIFSAVLQPGLGDDGPNLLVARLMEEHASHMETYRSRFDGRSLFFPPSPPPRPKVDRVAKPVVRDEAPPPPPPAPRAPARYTGPDIVALLGRESVWFSNGDQIGIGQEMGGVKVLEINPPWSARLAHKGGEYVVPLFADDESFLATAVEIDGSTSGLVEAAPSLPGEADDDDEQDPGADDLDAPDDDEDEPDDVEADFEGDAEDADDGPSP